MKRAALGETGQTEGFCLGKMRTRPFPVPPAEQNEKLWTVRIQQPEVGSRDGRQQGPGGARGHRTEHRLSASLYIQDSLLQSMAPSAAPGLGEKEPKGRLLFLAEGLGKGWLRETETFQRWLSCRMENRPDPDRDEGQMAPGS